MRNCGFYRRSVSIIVMMLLAVLFTGCSLLFGKSEAESLEEKVTAVSLSMKELRMDAGDIEYLKLTVTPSEVQPKVKPKWEFDPTYIDLDGSSSGATIRAKHEGKTWVKCTLNDIVATTIISITGNISVSAENPYIYSNTSVIDMEPGSTQTVSVSLYGGSVEQMEDFIWTIEDPSIATISSARNNCLITAKKNGTTQLIARHPDANYAYTMIVFIHNSDMNIPYITTDSNIVSINKSEEEYKVIGFTVKNPSVSSTANYQFHVEDTSDDKNKGCVEVVLASNRLRIIPKKAGLARLTVTNDQCEYPLEVFVRVTTTVHNVYVSTDVSTLNVDGNGIYTVNASIEGYDGFANPDLFEWTIPDEAYNYADVIAIGNSLQVMGKHEGYFKVKVRHELAEEPRYVMIVVTNQEADAIDSSMYITTSSNCITLKEGGEIGSVQVTLVGGVPGDEKDFVWSVDKGMDNEIVKLETVNGSIASRAVKVPGSDAFGTVYATPLSRGTVTITVSHPKCLYSTDILVKVYSEYAELSTDAKLYVDESIVKVVNGESVRLSSRMEGVSGGVDEEVRWESRDETNAVVSPEYGRQTMVSAVGHGTSQTYIDVTHHAVPAGRKVLVLTADNEEDFASMKYIHALNTYVRTAVGKKVSLDLDCSGMTDDEINAIKWEISDPGKAALSFESNRLHADLEGLREGRVTVTAKASGCEDVVFEVTIVPENEVEETINSSFLSTRLNAFVLEKTGETIELSVTGTGLSGSQMAETVWELISQEGEPCISIVSNGSTATATAVKNGTSMIRVSNPYSANSIIINAKVGSVLVSAPSLIPYIVTEKDTFEVTNGDTLTIAAKVENSVPQGAFTWSLISGDDIIDMMGGSNGRCFIDTKQAGKALIEIHNTVTEGNTGSKQILIVVNQTAEERGEIKYLSTASNVVTVGEGGSSYVTVTIVNANENVVSGFEWTSQDESIASVVSSGATAVVYGHKQGTTKISVTNYSAGCDFPLEIIVNCVDPVAAAANPYIMTPNIVTISMGDQAKTLVADLVGGTEADYTGFSWQVMDSSVCSLYGSNETASIRPVSEGVTAIVVRHPKAQADRTILVIVEPKKTTSCSITTTESIIRMSPSDRDVIVRATLVNGDADDIYDFVWWADSYDIIDMNYTQDSCIITPLSTGRVNVYVRHPKAAQTKTITINISQYDNFAFSQDYVTLTAGEGTSFIRMQVPVTSVTSAVKYKVSEGDEGVVQVTASTNSVCSLNPIAKGSATITAQLVAVSSGEILGTSTLLVYVKEADVDSTYISVDKSVITLSAGESTTISALLKGTSAQEGDENDIRWKIEKGTVLSGHSSGGWVNDGSGGRILAGEVLSITGKTEGETTITVTHKKAGSSRVIFVSVAGTTEASATLNYNSLEIADNDPGTIVRATVSNAQLGDEANLEWSVLDLDGNDITAECQKTNPGAILYLTGSGKAVTVTPLNRGEVVLQCKVPSSGLCSTCKIKVYTGASLKLSLSSLNVTPYNSVTVDYVTYPPEDDIETIYIDDKNYVTVQKKDHDPVTGEGQFLVFGMFYQGTTKVSVMTGSRVSAEITVTNKINYYFKVDKTIISSTPEAVAGEGGEEIMTIKYEISPHNAVVRIGGLGNAINNSENLMLAGEEGNNYQESKDYQKATAAGYEGYYEIYERYKDEVNIDPVTGRRTGYITFKLKKNEDGSIGQTNCTLDLEPVYTHYQAQLNGPVSDYKMSDFNTKLKVSVYCKDVMIVPEIQERKVFDPSTNKPSATNAVWSQWDETTSSLILGDGESVTLALNAMSASTGTPLALDIDWNNVAFEKNVNSRTYGDTYPSSDKYVEHHNPNGTDLIRLNHSRDFSKDDFFTLRGSSIDDVEQYNTVPVADVLYGTLVIPYKDYGTGQTRKYSIKVYLQVRNCKASYSGS